jgi:uncharacterized protein (TIGR00251 family)
VSDVDDLYALDGEHVVLAVHVQPRAGRSAVLGRHGNALRLRVAAPPVDDRANEAARTLLSEQFGIAPADIELVAGQRSRLKRFRLSNVDRDEFVVRLRRTVREADQGPGPRSRHHVD